MVGGGVAFAGGDFLLLAEGVSFCVEVVRPGDVFEGVTRGGFGVGGSGFAGGVTGFELGEVDGFFLGGGESGEEAEEESVDELIEREVLEGELGDAVVVTEAGEPDADGAVAEDGGLEGIGIGGTGADGVLTGAAPTEGFEDVADGLDAGEAEAGAVAFVAGAGEHPGAGGMAEGDGVFEIAAAIDVEADFLGVQGFAGGGEEGVEDLFGAEATWGGGGEEGAGGGESGIGGALVGVGVEDEAGEVFEAVTAADELAAEPGEEFGMGGLAALPVFDGFDDATAHELLPDPVGDDLSEALVLRGGDEGGEAVAGVFGGFGEGVREGFVDEVGEGPFGFDFAAGLEGDLDEGFAAAFVEFVHGHGAGGGDVDGFGFEEGGEFEEVLLAALMSGGVVAAGALHFDAEEGGADDGAFGGHGNVVAGGGAESGRAAEAFGALHAEEFGDEEVHGAVVGEGLVKIPAEGAGVVEGGVEDVRVFGEHVLPVAHPAVGPAGIGEEAVDGVGAFVGAGVGLESFDLGEGRSDADGVESDTTEEGEFVAERGDFDAGNVEFGPVSAFADPAFEGGDLIGG